VKRLLAAAAACAVIAGGGVAVADPVPPVTANTCVGCTPSGPFCGTRTSGRQASAYCNGSTFQYRVITRCWDAQRDSYTSNVYGYWVVQRGTSQALCPSYFVARYPTVGTR
jgi:hypothetical protein